MSSDGDENARKVSPSIVADAEAIKLRGLVVFLSAVVLSGCSQTALRGWARDEVTVYEQWRGDRDQVPSVELDIHNVESLHDGIYSISINDLRVMPPSHDGPDGVRQLDVAAIDGLQWVGEKTWSWEWGNESRTWANDWDMADCELPRKRSLELDAPSLARPDEERMSRREKARDGKRTLPPDLGTRLTRSEDRDYELEIFAFDDDAKRWVRIGRLVIGRGTQSPVLRKTGVVCLYPFAILVDIVLTPFALFDNQERDGCCLGPIPL